MWRMRSRRAFHTASIFSHKGRKEEGGSCSRSLVVLQFDFKNEVEGKVGGADEKAARAFHASTCQQATRTQEVGAKLPR